MKAKYFILIAVLLIGLIPVLTRGEVGETPLPAVTPTPDIKTLLEQLESSDDAQKIQAKRNLVQIGQAAAPDIVKGIPDAPPEKAYDLIIILRHITYPAAADTLRQVWEKSTDDRVKLAAAMVLCRLNEDYIHYQDYILSLTQDGDENKRLQAMQMLGYIEDARAVPVLKKVFYDESQPDKIRQAAIWDLTFTPVKESAQALVEILDDPAVDWFYKEIVIAGIRRLASQPGLAEVINELLEKAQRLPPTKPVALPAEK